MFLKRIRDLREDRDLYQRELAKYLGVDQSTYSDYESGRINLPLDVLTKLADFYNVNIDYLLERTDVKKAFPKRDKKYKSFRFYIK